MTGKTIRISHAGCDRSGILLTLICDWTGKMLVARRSQLDQLSKRKQVRRTDVNWLVAPSSDESLRAA